VEFREAQSKRYTGRKLPQETKDKISLWNVGKKMLPEQVEKSVNSRLRNSKLRGHYFSPKTIECMKIAAMSPAVQKNKRDGLRKYLSNDSNLRRKSRTSRNLWMDPVYRKKCINGAIESPNNAERYLETLLGELFPDEYKFVGDDSFRIESYNPDYVNINGQKKIIELFGERWHRGAEKEKQDARKLKTYKKYGYSALVVWGSELKNKTTLVEKLNMFHYGGKNE